MRRHHARQFSTRTHAQKYIIKWNDLLKVSTISISYHINLNMMSLARPLMRWFHTEVVVGLIRRQMQYVFNDVFLKQISIISFDIPLNNISWCQHTKPSQRLTQPDDNKINLHCGYAYNNKLYKPICFIPRLLQFTKTNMLRNTSVSLN